jgi:hypothetical protein
MKDVIKINTLLKLVTSMGRNFKYILTGMSESLWDFDW